MRPGATAVSVGAWSLLISVLFLRLRINEARVQEEMTAIRGRLRPHLRFYRVFRITLAVNSLS